MASYRVAYLVSHPIQYQAPLLRRISEEPDISLKVFFQSAASIGVHYDPGFGTSFDWDVPLVEGYDHVFLSGPDGSRGALRRYLQERACDALWIHGYAKREHLAAISTARANGVKVLIRGESHLHLEKGFLGRLGRRALLPRLFARVDAALAIGTWNREFYEAYGMDRSRIHLMPYAVDNSFFARAAREAQGRREAFRRELGLEMGRPVVLLAGKFEPRKRVPDVIEAFARLSREDGPKPSPYLLVVGDGPEREEVDRKVATLGLDSVRVLGFRNQTELPAFYDLCDVFVLASENEPWGLAINEAMACRRAVIVGSEAGCRPDLVEDGRNGYSVPARRPDVLADRIARTLASHRSVEMGRASAEIISAWDFEADVAGLRSALSAVCR